MNWKLTKDQMSEPNRAICGITDGGDIYFFRYKDIYKNPEYNWFSDLDGESMTSYYAPIQWVYKDEIYLDATKGRL